MSNEALQKSYERWFMPSTYDALAHVVFSPVGGLARLRRRALDHFAIAQGERVLELGCGSGGITSLLCERGAEVTSVDWSRPMLRRAARRAQGASFECSEITRFEPGERRFDVVLFCFVLHELDEAGRAHALSVARRALDSQGRLAIVDHDLPSSGWVARSLSRIVHGFEPETSRGLFLQPFGAETEAGRAGFTPGDRERLAHGMAFALQARPNGA